jgi:hypothetical protein
MLRAEGSVRNLSRAVQAILVQEGPYKGQSWYSGQQRMASVAGVVNCKSIQLSCLLNEL